jgi:hypothetical protein
MQSGNQEKGNQQNSSPLNSNKKKANQKKGNHKKAVLRIRVHKSELRIVTIYQSYEEI